MFIKTTIESVKNQCSFLKVYVILLRSRLQKDKRKRPRQG
jgi:hypothetical protein